MEPIFETLPFKPADILIPKDCDLSLWAVVACDQYTSQPEYWQRVEERVGRAPSALRLILPESCLEGPDVERDIMEINHTMSRYLKQGQFAEYPGSLVYVERKLDSGAVRRGLIGMVDLEQYDYEPGSVAPIRATEGTVLTRIPPRVAVRKNASLELPHVMLLTDDPQGTVIAPLAGQTEQMQPLYDTELMEGGGHVKGWQLTGEQKKQVGIALHALAEQDAFDARYQTTGQGGMLFAVGDGNHSLATAKECYERQKRITPPEQWANLPARYALCELVNLHDDSLEFEPIHRVVFGVDAEALLAELAKKCVAPEGMQGQVSHALDYITAAGRSQISLSAPRGKLLVDVLQRFLDQYLATRSGAWIDYIHGAEVAAELAGRPDAMAFLLPSMGKDELFPGVIAGGVLPRKTFSMGEAQDKRFYLEARKIRV